MTTPAAAEALTPAMTRAYADLRIGPLELRRHAFVGKSGRRHHTRAILGLVQRNLARVSMLRPRHGTAVLTPLGATLMPVQFGEAAE